MMGAKKGSVERYRRDFDRFAIAEYPRNRRFAEQRVKAAQEELDAAHEEEGLAWGSHRLEEALVELARLEARYRLALRRERIREEAAG